MSEIHKVAHCTLYTSLHSLRPSSPPVQPTTCLLRTRVTVPRPLAYYISRPSTLHTRPPCPDRRPQPALIRPPHSLLAGPYSWSSAAWPVQLLQLLLRGWLQLPPGGAHTNLDGRGHAQLRGSGGGWAWARWGRGCWSEHLPNPRSPPPCGRPAHATRSFPPPKQPHLLLCPTFHALSMVRLTRAATRGTHSLRTSRISSSCICAAIERHILRSKNLRVTRVGLAGWPAC